MINVLWKPLLGVDKAKMSQMQSHTVKIYESRDRVRSNISAFTFSLLPETMLHCNVLPFNPDLSDPLMTSHES